MKRLLALFFLALALHGLPAFAFTPFVVKDIRVEGLERIAAGTAFNYLPVKIGERLDAEGARAAIRALFRSGFFKDVRLERDGDVLVVVVRERPTISSIKISGNKEIETDPLLDSLKQIGLAQGRVFNRSLLDKVTQELRRQYFSRGRYGVRIDTLVTPLERNRVAISIKVAEGRVSRIRRIRIVGNQVFSDKQLLKQFQLSEPTLFSFYTGTDQYSKQKLAGDLETLKAWYLDRGYIDFRILSTQVSITPDKKDIYITIAIHEGKQFRIEKVQLAGNLVVAPKALFPLVDVNAGEIFSRKRVTHTVEAITGKLGDHGYAFANVNAIPDVDEKRQRVVLTFFIDPGKRVYVRRINMVGNTRTRDEVLRREMRQMEGGWFSAAAVKRSKTRLDRLGYFKEVNVETPPVPGTTDQVDVNYSVTEQPSGNLLVGLGYSQTAGILFNADISQDNFLGSGNRVSLSFNNSSVNTVYSFSYLNPYYTIDGISRGFGAYFRQTDAAAANLADYNTDTYGGNLSYGVPINEFDKVDLNLQFQNLQLKPTLFSPTQVTDFVTAQGDRFNTFLVTAGWSHDTRNRRIFPDRGMLHRLSLEAAVPGSDLEYYKVNYRGQVFVPLTRLLTFELSGRIGIGDGYGNFDQLPFFENFFAGGVQSVRGFQDNTLGPRDSRGQPLGGAFKLVGSAEVIFPPPFFTRSHSFRLSTFVDAGNVFADTNSFKVSELRYSVGLGATWLSPLGALTFSLAKTLNDKPGDDVQLFQFTIGTNF